MGAFVVEVPYAPPFLVWQISPCKVCKHQGRILTVMSVDFVVMNCCCMDWYVPLCNPAGPLSTTI